ncbi:MAG: hypothetical protein J5761_04140 [Paludibacteraceae bacterium]|nr:hypothetical protein [Paludibacteraceae bacterium]
MKKIFLFAAAIMASVTMSATVSIDACILDSAKLAQVVDSAIHTKTYSEGQVAAGTVLHDGADMKVSLPYAQQLQWVSAEQPNGAHKSIAFGDLMVINMNAGIQGKDNPKDADGGNPCNTLLAPVSGGCFQIDSKADGWIVVLHKASSNKQYFVFEEGTALGYKFGMMTYVDANKNTLGENGLLQYELVGDEEENYLTAQILEANTGFSKIEFVENYFNLDTVASGYSLGTYKQNGVSAIAFKAYEELTYLVGAAGSKMTCAAIVFVKDLEDAMAIVAKGGTVEPKEGEAGEAVAYADVELLQIEPEDDEQGVENVNAAVKAHKVFENGQLLIIKNGVRYNALGTVVE